MKGGLGNGRMHIERNALMGLGNGEWWGMRENAGAIRLGLTKGIGTTS